MKRNTLFLSGAVLAVTTSLLTGCASGTQLSTTRTFEVTLTNLTSTADSSGQPFSPPIFVTHDATTKLWELNGTASLGIQNIAETGSRAAQVSALQPLASTSVLSMETPLSSPLRPGASVTVRVKVDAAHPYLSHAWMLERTNDAFGGQDRIDLFPQEGTRTYELVGLDAGTEVNNEKRGFLGSLGGGNARDPENGLIRLHEGITGRGDAPLSWSWGDPVARVTITPVDAA
nr:spondin domain-containing protein [Armatimonas sp.]